MANQRHHPLTVNELSRFYWGTAGRLEWARWLGGVLLILGWSGGAIAQPTELCPEPVLTRLQTHQVQAGENLEDIANAYGLLPVTLLAMNPSINEAISPGTTLRIPPFNGAAVTVPAGQTWQDLAATYQTRADVLFEINGCPDTLPDRVFIPGVSWLLEGSSVSGSATTADPLSAYPAAVIGTIISNYGWQTDDRREELVFSSGVTVSLPPETPIVAAGDGTVAFVGTGASNATLIVINHANGVQTRYGQVTESPLQAGDQVRAGQSIAIATPFGDDRSLLYFEVRTNSSLGWVARNPGDYIPDLAVR